jgi:hypothetical protein
MATFSGMTIWAHHGKGSSISHSGSCFQIENAQRRAGSRFESKSRSAVRGHSPHVQAIERMHAMNNNDVALELRCGFGETWLGLTLVVVSVNGVVAILLGDDRRRSRRWWKRLRGTWT